MVVHGGCAVLRGARSVMCAALSRILRLEGGLACLWHRPLGFPCGVLTVDDGWFAARLHSGMLGSSGRFPSLCQRTLKS